jgi:hypothetical protein
MPGSLHTNRLSTRPISHRVLRLPISSIQIQLELIVALARSRRARVPNHTRTRNDVSAAIRKVEARAGGIGEGSDAAVVRRVGGDLAWVDAAPNCLFTAAMEAEIGDDGGVVEVGEFSGGAGGVEGYVGKITLDNTSKLGKRSGYFSRHLLVVPL